MGRCTRGNQHRNPIAAVVAANARGGSEGGGVQRVQRGGAVNVVGRARHGQASLCDNGAGAQRV